MSWATPEREVVLPRLRNWRGPNRCGSSPTSAPGTGMLADVFSRTVTTCLPSNPIPRCAKRCAALHNPKTIEVIDGTAEVSTLSAHSINLICMGQERLRCAHRIILRC